MASLRKIGAVGYPDRARTDYSHLFAERLDPSRGHLAKQQTLNTRRSRAVRPHAQTTQDTIFARRRFYTLSGDKLPGGRGHGDPVRLMVDLPNDQDIVALFVYRPGEKVVVASSDGRGFVVPEDNVIAQTKNGKQVLNVGKGNEAQACAPVRGDTMAVVGDNRKIIIFPLDELPEMTRGRGVKLQGYKDGGLADLTTFIFKEGLPWKTVLDSVPKPISKPMSASGPRPGVWPCVVSPEQPVRELRIDLFVSCRVWRNIPAYQ